MHFILNKADWVLESATIMAVKPCLRDADSVRNLWKKTFEKVGLEEEMRLHSSGDLWTAFHSLCTVGQVAAAPDRSPT